MSPRVRRSLAVVAAAFAVAVVLVWATGTGPRGVVGLETGDAVTVQPGRPQPTPAQDDQRDTAPTRSDQSPVSDWDSDLLTVISLIAGLWLSALVARGVVVRISRRLPDKRLVVDVETLPDGPGADGHEEMVRGAERQREALATSDVRNGIVRCWVLLEEAAGRAGVLRLPAETATEFVVRFLHALDVDPRPVGELETLFHEARYSTHPLTEEHRSRALRALDRIHDELAAART